MASPPVPLPISSSAFVAAFYETESEELVLVFKDGTVYSYDVSPEELLEFLTAGSKGEYFNANIRSRGGTKLG